MTGPVGIAGAGAFGTALADVVAARGREVILFGEDPETMRDIAAHHRNERRLPGVSLAPTIRATSDPTELAQARLVVLAVPSTRVEAACRRLGDSLDGGHLVVHALGAFARDGALISEVVGRETPVRRVGVLAGPALAADLADRRPSAVVVASGFDEVVAAAREALSAPPTLRVYGSRDLLGVELAAALSGAMTVAVGMADGLEMGAGPRAVLVTRAAAEAARVVERLGGDARSFFGLAGLGNLLTRTSASSERSDDYQLGLGLGRAGRILSREVRRETEGSRSVEVAAGLAERRGVHAPILAALSAVLRSERTGAEVASELLESTALAE